MRDAIRALKYDGLRPVAHRLGAMLALAMEKLDGEAPFALLVVPVPLHRAKHAQRGFNQARLLAIAAIAALRKQDSRWSLELAPRTLLRRRPPPVTLRTHKSRPILKRPARYS